MIPHPSLYQCKLWSGFTVGVKHSEAWKLFEILQSDIAENPKGLRLRMVRDPENEYDTNAIGISRWNWNLGWVPRSINPILTELLDQDVPLVCTLIQVDSDAIKYDFDNPKCIDTKLSDLDLLYRIHIRLPSKGDKLAPIMPPELLKTQLRVGSGRYNEGVRLLRVPDKSKGENLWWWDSFKKDILCGEGGYVIVRDGVPIESITTAIS